MNLSCSAQREFEIENYFTHLKYRLVPAEILPPDCEYAEQVARICNEPLIYNLLFRERFGGRPYGMADAEGFMQWATSGWKDLSYFVFFAISPDSSFAGVIDIKSSDRDFAEIGYWVSSHHRGLATSMLGCLLEFASASDYRRLFARVRKDNQASMKVLENNGFERDLSWEEDPIGYRYVRSLSDRREPKDKALC